MRFPHFNRRPSEESYNPDDVRDRLVKTASRLGVSIDNNPVLDRLLGMAGEHADFRESLFNEYGLWVRKPYKSRMNIGGDTRTRRVSGVDFKPRTQEQPGGAVTPQDRERTRVMLNGIYGLQSYVLLMEAGILDKPDILVGLTNESMSDFGERFGFKPTGETGEFGGSEIYAHYGDIAGTVLSNSMTSAAEMLARRLEKHGQAVGFTAVGNNVG